MKVGILGFPGSGKTTVFNALTSSDQPVGPAAGRGKSRIGIADVRDDRLPVLAEMWNPKKITTATVEYVDVPGVAPGTSGLSGYLAEFKALDAILHVIRGFEDESLPHVFDGIDAARDAEAMEAELLLSDLALVESRLEKIAFDLSKKKDEALQAEAAVLEQFKPVLEEEKPLRSRSWPENDLAKVRGLALLTLKPLLHVLNRGEEEAGDGVPELPEGLAALNELEATGVTQLFGKIEAEIALLAEEDATAFLEDLGLSERTADRVAAASYALLDLISFLTAGEQEVRAWPIRRGTVARGAAGRIHSDIERGFIRAELVGYDDLVAAGSWAAARDTGTLRLEGKDYVVKDGDVILFRFNVG
ncbi:MAG: DUF933 domain-containing protein [Acidobacteriota bacterium]